MLVPSLHDDLILTADAVDRLFAEDATLSRVSTSSMGKTAQFELPQKPMKLDKTE